MDKLSANAPIKRIIGNTAVDQDSFDPPILKRIELPDQYIAPRPKPAARPILLYNDQCEVCKMLSAWVKDQDARGRDLIDERPIGNDPEALLAIHPELDIWKVYEKIHLVMPDGQVKVGGEAIAEVLKRLNATSYVGALSDVSLFGKKPFLSVIDASYTLLDRIRPALGCASCGGGNVPWWAKPIQWTADLVRKIRG